MPRLKPTAPQLVLAAAALPLSGCISLPSLPSLTSSQPSAKYAVPSGASMETAQYGEVKSQLDSMSPQPMVATKAKITVEEVAPAIRGLGFAQVRGQQGKTTNEKRLMAIRAARLEAMRDLTEQVHGLRLNSNTLMRDMVIRDDTVRATVDGEIRGARTVRITPKDSDTFEVVLELDISTIGYIVRVAKGRI